VPGQSIGVFSVMQHVELCRQWQLRWLYLGYWVPGSRAMQYKAGYRPHELRLGGHWQPGEV
jgi:arginine-tRNA-protein transferase